MDNKEINELILALSIIIINCVSYMWMYYKDSKENETNQDNTTRDSECYEA